MAKGKTPRNSGWMVGNGQRDEDGAIHTGMRLASASCTAAWNAPGSSTSAPTTRTGFRAAARRAARLCTIVAVTAPIEVTWRAIKRSAESSAGAAQSSKGTETKTGPRGGGHGGVNGPRQCRRHVLRSRRLDTPLHERSRKLRSVNVRELGLQRDHRASLLPGHDHQRRMRDGGVDQHAHGVAEAGGRMHVDEHRPPGRLGVAVSHAQYDAFVQSEDVSEVARELTEERQFVRTGVPKYGGHSVRAEQFVGDLVHGFHESRPLFKACGSDLSLAPSSVRPMTMRARVLSDPSAGSCARTPEHPNTTSIASIGRSIFLLDVAQRPSSGAENAQRAGISATNPPAVACTR